MADEIRRHVLSAEETENQTEEPTYQCGHPDREKRKKAPQSDRCQPEGRFPIGFLWVLHGL